MFSFPRMVFFLPCWGAFCSLRFFCRVLVFVCMGCPPRNAAPTGALSGWMKIFAALPVISGHGVISYEPMTSHEHQLQRLKTSDHVHALTTIQTAGKPLDLVAAKMKVADRGYGVATFGILTKDGLRNTTLTRCGPTSGRIQGFAHTSHTVPIAQAIFHQETDSNFQWLFRRVDLLWQQSAHPSRPSLASVPLQLHKDFNSCIESAREACFPNSRGRDGFSIFPRNKIQPWLLNVKSYNSKGGSGSKQTCRGLMLQFDWFVSCPLTLKVFSSVWHGLLARLSADNETELVAWLRTYERPLPFCLHDKYQNSTAAVTYVSFWGGLEDCIPGSGSGNQPAEALHSPWQARLSELGGKGNVFHVLSVMQKLYTEKSASWFDLSSTTPLSFHTEAGVRFFYVCCKLVIGRYCYLQLVTRHP